MLELPRQRKVVICLPLIRRGCGLSSSSEVMEDDEGSMSLTPESAGLGGWDPIQEEMLVLRVHSK
jgi:hypothetical protein